MNEFVTPAEAPKRLVDMIVLHCADTPNGKYFDASHIDQWHKERGFGRGEKFFTAQNPDLRHIGYHYVILLDGTIQTGRHLDEVGAHAIGVNARSIGICLIGKDRFSVAQWESLKAVVWALQKRYPGVSVVGHRDVNPGRTCPGFDVEAWKSAQYNQSPEHVCTAIP